MILKYRCSDVLICRQVPRIQSQPEVLFSKVATRTLSGSSVPVCFSYFTMKVSQVLKVEILLKVLRIELEIQELCQQ